MRRRHLGTVRVRLTAAVTLLVLVVGGFAAAWFVQRVESSLVDDAEDRNAQVLDDLVVSLANGEDPRDLLLPFQVAVPPGDVPDALPEQAFFVAGPGFEAPGTVVVFRGDAGIALAADQFDSTDWPAPAGPTIETQVLPDDAKVLAAGGGLVGSADLAVASLPVSSAAGTGELIAASPLDDVRNSVDALSRGLWLAVPALALAMGALAWMVTGRALRPVEAIARQADEISATNLHQRVPEPTTDDEVAHLARTVNGMLSRLEDGADRQRRFVSDASHELRSPVSAIRTQVEVGLLHPDTDWDHVGQTVLNESARLEQLIDDLLTLARMSELAATVEPAGRVARCDLRDVVTTEVGRSRSTPVEIEIGADDSIWVAVNGTDLERVLRHLLDNAARHARAVVQVSIRPEIDSVTLLVDDDGPGIAPDDRQRVLERFTRLDEGRARDDGGTGLGLAVVAEVVQSIGGALSVEESPLGGARIRVTLPSSSAT